MNSDLIYGTVKARLLTFTVLGDIYSVEGDI